MGIIVSTPNFIAREDQLFFPNEILLKIVRCIPPRDMLWARLVCRSWLRFLADDVESFIGDQLEIHVGSSESRIHELATGYMKVDETSIEENEFHLSRMMTAFLFSKVELTRHPLSLQFWSLYSDSITRLELTDCAVLARNAVGDAGRMEFRLGCPNLKKLALRDMEKSFMMGADYIQFHKILELKNLISLDLSGNNKYLTDRILFNLLLATEKLESLNLTQCSIVQARSIHNRFYPQFHGTTVPLDLQFSDNILSLHTLVHAFLLTPKGSNVHELILKATSMTSWALNLMSSPDFTWKSLDLSYCRELKKNEMIQLVANHCGTLEKFSFKSDGRGLSAFDVLQPSSLPQLTHLSVRNCCFDTDVVECVTGYVKLKHLSCPNSAIKGNLETTMQFSTFGRLKHLTYLNISESPTLVTDTFLQVVIQNLLCLTHLNLRGCNSLTDSGFTGIEASHLENLEEGNEYLSLTLRQWLLRGGIVPRKSEQHEQLLNELIVRDEFPLVLDPAAFPTLPDRCSLSNLKGLEQLDIGYIPNLTSATLHLAVRLPFLFKLDISGNENVSLNGIAAVCRNCSSLEYLVMLRSNPLVTMEAFNRYAHASLKRLRRLIY